MRKIFLLIIIIFFTTNVFAYNSDDLTWDGYLTINLDKEVFENGENITGNIVITNEEYYPIIGNTIIIQIADNLYSYPSQNSNENIFYETILKENWLLPRANKIIPFSINSTGLNGEYHLSVYSWIQKSMFNGSDSILLGAQTKNFLINGQKELNVIIQKNTTNFGKEKQIGPVGFPVLPNETFSGQIFIENKSNKIQDNLELELMICDWSCSISKAVSIKEFNVGKLNSLEIKEINVDLVAPEIPSAYEIKMILKNNNEIKSIYSNRVIVTGGTSKIRKILIKGLEEEDFSISTLIAGSPDHFTYPEFNDFELQIEVYNEGQSNQKQNQSFDLIETGEIKDSNFYLGKVLFDRICLRVIKANKLFEEECFDVPLAELIKAENERHPQKINVEWNYNKEGKNLEIILTKPNQPINSRIRLIDFEKSFINERIEQENMYKNNFFVENGKYTLIVNDFDAKRQETIELYLGISEDEVNLGSQVIPLEELSCKGTICKNGFVCDSQPIVSKEGDCCLTQCIPSGKTLLGFEEIMPLLFWIAILLFIGSIFVFHGSIKKARGKKK